MLSSEKVLVSVDTMCCARLLAVDVEDFQVARYLTKHLSQDIDRNKSGVVGKRALFAPRN